MSVLDRSISRRSALMLSGLLLPSFALTGCGQDNTPQDPSAEKLDSLVAYLTGHLKEVDIDYFSVYSNEDRSQVFYGSLVQMGYGSEAHVEKVFQTEDGSWDTDAIGSIVIPSSVSFDNDVCERLDIKSIRDYLHDIAKVYYEALQDSMYDPDSAKYDEIEVAYFPAYDHEGYAEGDVICNDGVLAHFKVNAKNRLGGYAGNRSFLFYNNFDVEYVEDDDKNFNKIYGYLNWVKDTYSWLYSSFSQEDM